MHVAREDPFYVARVVYAIFGIFGMGASGGRIFRIESGIAAVV
jgi:hypothetical protein